MRRPLTPEARFVRAFWLLLSRGKVADALALRKRWLARNL